MTENPPSPDTPENWGLASRGYGEKVAPVMMRPFVDAVVDRLGAAPGSRVLEVGAGSGVLTEVLSPVVGAMVAVDFSPPMIDLLDERLAAAGIANVTSIVMDGQVLEFGDASFDAAASSFTVMLFPDRAKGFAEMCRVVRPGGRIVATGWTGPPTFEAFGLFMAALQRAFPDMPPPPTPPPVFSLADPAVFRREMEQAGIRDVEAVLESRELQLQDAEQAWGMMTTGAPPVRMLFDRVGPAGKKKVREALDQIVEERYAGGPFALTNVATLGFGGAS